MTFKPDNRYWRVTAAKMRSPSESHGRGTNTGRPYRWASFAPHVRITPTTATVSEAVAVVGVMRTKEPLALRQRGQS